MPAKISKEVTELGKSCRFLLTALMRQGGRVADILHQNVQPHREEGDEEPGFFGSIVALARRLGASFNQLVKADVLVYTLNAKLTALRNKRNDLTLALGLELVRERRTIMGQYLAPDLEGLGLQSPRVRTADVLLRQVDVMSEVFQSEGVDQLLGERAYEGEGVDPRTAAAKPIAIATELRSTMVEIDETQRELDVAIIEKDEVKAEHGELFVYTARAFEAQCRLAGLRKLAGKVRPSERQPGRRAQEVGEGGEEGDLPPDGDPPPAGDPAQDDVPGSV